jgi:hypothetical protein
MDFSLILALLSGVAIAAACGLRAFLPLLLLGCAARVELIDLRPGVEWLRSDHALWALAAAAVIEIAGDKIPVVDHALDVMGTLLRPAAAWLGAYAVLQAWPSPWAQIAALVPGGMALAVHGLKAKLRLGSTVTTLGHGNPLLSVAEDVAALGAALVAVLAPLLALALLGAAFWTVARRRVTT